MAIKTLCLVALLLLGCGTADAAAELGQLGADRLDVCAVPTLLEQPRERLADDTCWLVRVPAGFGLTERGGDCKDAPECLLTRSTAVERQLLDWTAEGEDNPETWREVRCDERCDQ